MGTPEFARKPLACLHESRHEIVAVVTGPDERSRRGGRLLPTPVCVEAERLGLVTHRPASLKNEGLYEVLKAHGADLIVVVAFKILPEKLFTLPPLGSINIHASLLPKYRGAAPINWALINGERETGLTGFFLKKRVDTGDIILQEKVTIADNDTFDSLSARLSDLAGPFLLRILDLIDSRKAECQPQKEELACPAPKIRPFDAMIDFGLPAQRVRDFVRGLSSQPGAYTFFRGKRVKILSCEVYSGPSLNAQPGTILDNRKKLLVRCADSVIEVCTLVLEGKKPIAGESFLNGVKPRPRERFGEIYEKG